jgi:hypothetical protein
MNTDGHRFYGPSLRFRLFRPGSLSGAWNLNRGCTLARIFCDGNWSSSVRSAMFIETTAPDARPSCVGAASMRILASTEPWQRPSERENMPLLRSLADRAARAAIDMALLTELFASPPPPFRRVEDACRVQTRGAHSGPVAFGDGTRNMRSGSGEPQFGVLHICVHLGSSVVFPRTDTA